MGNNESVPTKTDRELEKDINFPTAHMRPNLRNFNDYSHDEKLDINTANPGEKGYTAGGVLADPYR